jgi:hypothetical protein
MVCLKNFLAGMLALTVAALIAGVIFLGGPGRRLLTDGAVFFVVHWHLWRTLCVSLPIFAAGFYWQYRRARPSR